MAIRAVRAFRPLRALKRVPGMPVLVSSLLQSLPPLMTVAAIAAFFFLVFGIVSMNLFKGVLHYRCALPASPPTTPVLDSEPQRSPIYAPDPASMSDTGMFCARAPEVCADVGGACTYFDDNPGSGTSSFDNVPMAMMALLRVGSHARTHSRCGNAHPPTPPSHALGSRSGCRCCRR